MASKQSILSFDPPTMEDGLEDAIREAMEYLFEEDRRKTFKKWVFAKREVCNADKMAAAGFIFTGNKQEPDSVKCFLCGKSLDGWEASDDPWKEHLTHAPNCSFAKLQTEENNITLGTFLDLKDELIKKAISNYMERLEAEVEKEADEMFEEICNKLNL